MGVRVVLYYSVYTIILINNNIDRYTINSRSIAHFHFDISSRDFIALFMYRLSLVFVFRISLDVRRDVCIALCG